MPHFPQDFTYLKASCPFCDSTLSVSAGILNARSGLLSNGSNLAKRHLLTALILDLRSLPLRHSRGSFSHLSDQPPISWCLIQKDVVSRKRGMWQPVFHFQLIQFFSKCRGDKDERLEGFESSHKGQHWEDMETDLEWTAWFSLWVLVRSEFSKTWIVKHLVNKQQTMKAK